MAVIVLVGGTLAALNARAAGDHDARERVTAVATTIAAAPSSAEAILSGAATAQLQPVTESVRRSTGMAFITIMAPDRTRYTHTTPSMIGGKYIGSIDRALAGETFTEVSTGTLGPSVRAITPIRDPDGRIVGLVAAGITQETLTAAWYAQLPLIIGTAAAAAAVALIGLMLLRRRLRRATGGLAPEELRVMYDHHDAVLHAVSEGLIVSETGEPVLINDEARRLLDLPDGDLDVMALPDFLARIAATSGVADGDDPIRDELHVTDNRVLVVNSAPVPGLRGSSVITIRDRTEVQAALGELDSMTRFAEALRSSAHESANRLHTIVTLVEMGRPDDAVRFGTEEFELSQSLIDRITRAVGEPAVAALLLGKTSQAAERGIALTVTDDSEIDAAIPDAVPGVLSPVELITVVGNLVDNALDACDPDDPWVEVTVRNDARTAEVVVADSGPGMDAAAFGRAVRRGYSTKSGGDGAGRGLGLALVSQVVRRHRGSMIAENTYGSVVTVRVDGSPQSTSRAGRSSVMPR
ncbi:sensor histidine kinase [Williamsia sterculiae]|nr:ATP-binding protein [Williamsia sterculiae]